MPWKVLAPPMTARQTRAADALRGHIAVRLGPVAAEAAVTPNCYALGRDPESVEVDDAPRLRAGARPMRGTWLGGSSCRILPHRIEHDLRS
jgi:hypothetical protein